MFWDHSEIDHRKINMTPEQAMKQKSDVKHITS